MTVITMTREMGSCGRDVAIGLAERLGCQILHHEVVRRLADRMHVQESAVERYLEGSDNALQRWRLKRKNVDYYSAEEIIDIASEGNVIIRGWGATQLLRPVAHVVSVRVCAPMEQRVETLRARMELTDSKGARLEIESNDAAQTSTVKRLFGSDWRESLHYDIVLNTGRIPVDECVEQVVRLSQLPAFQETPGSRAALAAQRPRSQTAVRSPAQWVERRSTGQLHGPSLDRPVMREDRDLL